MFGHHSHFGIWTEIISLSGDYITVRYITGITVYYIYIYIYILGGRCFYPHPCMVKAAFLLPGTAYIQNLPEVFLSFRHIFQAW